MKSSKHIVSALPTIGILIFCCLYFYSASLYPGGSQADLNSVGFDWINNYWCNLMNEQGMNGIQNPARPFAISAMLILCSSLTLFFIQFSKQLEENRNWKWIIQTLGTISMISAVLIFTKYHDIMTTISSIFGVFVVIGIIRTIYNSYLTVFKISGVACVLLLGINNLIYYSENYIEHLPLIQKITFVLVLVWIVGLNFKMMNKNRRQ
ncbi:MAG: hypothetical protein CMO01_08515 [Thalassobius sp.]|nr:hypothetical protein [Thalassovita sp.]